MTRRARFAVGRLVPRRLCGCLGFGHDLDPEFQGSDEWHGRAARLRRGLRLG